MREPEILHLRAEKPRAFRQMAERLYGENINYQKLANDLHLPVFWTKQIMDSHASKAEPMDTSRDITSSSAPDEEESADVSKQSMPFQVYFLHK